MQVELIPATRQQEPVLAKLLELYADDFRKFQDIPQGSDGRFYYAPLPLYWTQPDRHPFLLMSGGTIVGFVFVGRRNGCWDIVEFFVLPAHRRRRLGTQAAHAAWHRFPGKWTVRVLRSNRPAGVFWRHAITAFTRQPAASVPTLENGELWDHFSFESA